MSERGKFLGAIGFAAAAYGAWQLARNTTVVSVDPDVEIEGVKPFNVGERKSAFYNEKGRKVIIPTGTSAGIKMTGAQGTLDIAVHDDRRQKMFSLQVAQKNIDETKVAILGYCEIEHNPIDK